MNHPLTFGFCMPTFASPGPALFRAPGWSELVPGQLIGAAIAAEALGFDSIWVPDHYMIGADHAVLDGWTTLAVIAGATRRARLCLIQQSTLFRHAPQFAKMVATLDQLSGGRLTVFSNLGRAEAEHRAYGFPWPSAFSDRLERHEEALEVLRTLWTAVGPVSHQGKYFTLRDAIGLPKPLQQPYPPLWFAGSESEVLELTARIGSGWNTPPVSLQDFRRMHAALRDAVQAAGREISEFTVSLETQVLIRQTIGELRETLRSLASWNPRSGTPRTAIIDLYEDPFMRGETDILPAALTDRYLIGIPSQVRDQLSRYVEEGVNSFGCWFMDFPNPLSAEILSELVGMTRP